MSSNKKQELRKLLCESVERNEGEAFLLSGGIDTSALAACGCIEKAFTVVMSENALDYKYAVNVARKFNLEHHVIRITEKELLGKIPEVIKILKSFDPALPNDLTIYVGLLEAKNHGLKSIITGDAADELFAGYNYMQTLSEQELEDYTKYLAKTMNFSSNRLGNHLGIDVKQPYRDKRIVDYSIRLTPELKIKQVRNKTWGKWILRKAFEEDLGEIAWREKAPIEFGSGTSQLRESIRSRISDEELNNKKRAYGLDFLNKEHLYFYEVYKEVVGEVKKAEEGKNKCPRCGAELKGYHCSTCGFASPIKDIK